MQIYQPTQKGPLKISGFIDPDDVTIIRVNYGATTWHANTVYRSNDVVKPTKDNGFYYTVTTNGRSNLTTEPDWQQDETTDNSITWAANPWDLWLLPDQVLTHSSWVATTGVTLGIETKSDVFTTVFIDAVDPTLTEFELTNQVTKDNGEKLSRSFLYKINQQ